MSSSLEKVAKLLQRRYRQLKAHESVDDLLLSNDNDDQQRIQQRRLADNTSPSSSNAVTVSDADKTVKRLRAEEANFAEPLDVDDELSTTGTGRRKTGSGKGVSPEPLYPDGDVEGRTGNGGGRTGSDHRYHPQRLPSVRDLIARCHASVPRAKPLPHVSLENLEDVMKESATTGDIVLNSPRSVEACRRAGIEAQDLFPVSLKEVYLSVDRRQAPSDPLRRAVAKKRYEASEKERQTLLTMVQAIRQRIIKGGGRSLSPFVRRSSSKAGGSGAPPSERGSATPSRGRSATGRSKPRADAQSLARVRDIRTDETVCRKQAIAQLEEDQAWRQFAEVEMRTQQARLRAQDFIAKKQCHNYCDPNEPLLTPRRQRGRSPSPRVGAAGSPGRSFIVEDHSAEVIRRAKQIEAIRVEQIEGLRRERSERIAKGGQSPARSRTPRREPTPRSRAFSVHYEERQQTAAQRANAMAKMQVEAALSKENVLAQKIEEAKQKKASEAKELLEARAIRSEERTAEAKYRRELIDAFQHEMSVEESERTAERHIRTDTRRAQSIRRQEEKHAERVAAHEERTAQVKWRCEKIDEIRYRQAATTMEERFRSQEQHKVRVEVERALRAEANRERTASQARRAERQRKAIEYLFEEEFRTSPR